MQRILLKSKIHEARVTGKELHYAGSLALDEELMEAAELACGEQVHVLNVSNGERIVTYVFPAKKGSGVVSVKGAAARLFDDDDIILVLSYAQYDEDELDAYSHRIVYVDEKNHLVRVENRTEEDYLSA